MLPRIAHRMPQTLQPVALHQTHRARVVMRPDRLAAVALRGAGQSFGDKVERAVPRDRRERRAADALVADPAQRRRETLRMVLPLGVAPDLRADHAIGIALAAGAANAADPGAVDQLDLERASARAIVRADAERGIERQCVLRPAVCATIPRTR